MFRKARRLHFVGIGGSGMSGIAEVLVNLRYPVSGSDLTSNHATRRLKQLGARIHRGHRAAHVRDADVVVVSSAVRPDNPEVIEARRLEIPVIPRAEMLAELMRMKYGVAVAGAHGKTSTTAMIAEVLGRGRLDPTVVIGGRIAKLRSGAKLGRGEIMVAEADESDGSFLRMKPTIAVVTNIDREHLDHYRDLGEIQDAFVGFLRRVPFYGAAVVCVDDPNVRAILPRIERKLIRYGLSSEADISAESLVPAGLAISYTARAGGRTLGRVRLQVPGRHSVYNSLAAVAVGLELDVPFRSIAAALHGFPGVERRMQLRGTVGGATVLDDYGHHPTEIEATLSAVREGFGARTVVVFQPHRYTRTQALLEDFGRAFFLADSVIVTDVYAAGEPPLPGVDGAAVARALERHGHPAVRYEPSLKAIPRLLRATLRPGEVLLTLGAGDVWKVGEALLARGQRRAAG
ncbi:MAG TPA: UDP-N-acetylmuramate--L-alanine ligase [Candidatus Polarisedimenticolaceae bacterium]|nr:UDP-N-acetylmuramate--L-alanine ligase [Candidatus Polarisedimenticolaceae bacterium]